MIVDGRTLASAILEATKERVVDMERTPVVRAITCAPSAATLSYLRIKAARAEDAGMSLEVVRLPDDASEEQMIEAIQAPGADAVIVQLPLPGHINTARVVDAIPVALDADVLSADAYQAFLSGDGLLPPVVAAVETILEQYYIDPMGARAVVVGQGKLVGLPVASWLTRMGAHVTPITEESPSREPLRTADIVVTGAGVPGLVTPDYVQEGAVLIDAGTSESGGQMVGDIDPAAASKAQVFTPVPGGVGPIAVACLFRNVAELLERSLQGR